MNDSIKKPAEDILDEFGRTVCELHNGKISLQEKLNKLTGIVNKFFIHHPIVYDEYGGGARILSAGGDEIADFKCHIDAETFMELIDEIRKGSTDLRGEEAKESQDEQVEKME